MAVSLNAHDRRALDLIEEELAGSDPRFAAKLSAFTRLTEGGEMPARERIRSRRRRGPGWALRAPRPGSHGRPRWSLYRTMLAVWLSVSLAMILIALGLSHAGTTAACSQWRGLVCVSRTAPSAPPAPAGH